MDRFKIKAILTGLSFLFFGMGLNFTTSFAQDQPSREAEGARLLHGAIDMHFHMDLMSQAAHNHLHLHQLALARDFGCHQESEITKSISARIESPAPASMFE